METISKGRQVFPDDHDNLPGVTYEHEVRGERKDDGTIDETTVEKKERSFKRENHPDGPPPWASNPSNPGERKPPEVSGNS